MIIRKVLTEIFVLGLGMAGWMTAQQQDTLTLEKAVQIALANNPAMQIARGNLQGAQAALVQTRSIFMPQINLSAAVTKTGGISLIGPIQRTQNFESYSTGASASLLVFDFGRSIYRTTASSYSVDASEAGMNGAAQTVILNAELAYFAYQEAGALVGVAEDALKSANEHLQQTKAFYSVGTRAQFDVTKAEVDAANAQVALLGARNNYRTARLQLENTMGIQTSTIYVTPEKPGLPVLDVTADKALALAQDNRPELLSMQSQLHASEALYTSTWMMHLPSINATGGYTWRGLSFPLVSGWNAGVTVSVPLFQGFSIDGAVQQAEAGVQIASASYTSMLQSVRLEIDQQIFALDEARQRIDASAKLVEQAAENLKLAEARYNSGVGSAIEITDAIASMSNARITQIQAQFDYRSAYARLHRAIGNLNSTEQQ